MRGSRSWLEGARAGGAGAANGAGHWLWQRVTAIALAPLSVWFVVSFMGLIDADHRAYSAWVRSPLNGILMIAFVVALFIHMGLGLQVIVEDYIHAGRLKRFAIVSLQLGCAGLAIASGAAIVRMLA